MKHLFALLSLCFALQAVAGEDPPPAAPAKPKVSYYGFTNDIVTNYVTTGAKDLGYVRVTMELMVKDEKYLPLIEHHDPIIQDTIVKIFGKEPADKVKSLTGREEIRLAILNEIHAILKKETGDELVQDVLFTKYLYQ